MRLFAGIRVPPSDEIRQLLDQLGRCDCLKAVEPENLHINLKFFGEVDEGKAGGIGEALGSAAGFGPFEVALEGVGAFPNQKFMRVLWIGAHSDRLMALHGLLDAELARLGFNIEADYKPHITLARVRRRPPAEIAGLLGERGFGTVSVRSLELIESVLAETGPRYTTIQTVKL